MALSQWSKARAHKDFEASLQTYQVGAHFEALNEPVHMVLSDSRYTQIVFNHLSVQVCISTNMSETFRHFLSFKEKQLTVQYFPYLYCVS